MIICTVSPVCSLDGLGVEIKTLRSDHRQQLIEKMELYKNAHQKDVVLLPMFFTSTAKHVSDRNLVESFKREGYQPLPLPYLLGLVRSYREIEQCFTSDIQSFHSIETIEMFDGCYFFQTPVASFSRQVCVKYVHKRIILDQSTEYEEIGFKVTKNALFVLQKQNPI